jgi:hypothetical protein
VALDLLHWCRLPRPSLADGVEENEEEKNAGERDEGVDGAFQKCPIVVIATALK